jgi:hypothetical protein
MRLNPNTVNLGGLLALIVPLGLGWAGGGATAIKPVVE